MMAVANYKVTSAISARMLRSIMSKGRMIAVGGFALLAVLIAIIVQSSDPDPTFIPADFLLDFGLVIFTPLVVLVIASATFGNLREDRNLVYFWLRPISRWEVTASGFISGLLVLLPLVTIPLAVLGVILGDSDDIVGIVIAGLVGVVGYTALFTFWGLLSSRALIWGLIYVLVWEGFIAGLSTGAGRLSIRSYSSSALVNIAEEPTLFEDAVSTPVAMLVIVLLAAACFTLTTLRLSSMEVD